MRQLKIHTKRDQDQYTFGWWNSAQRKTDKTVERNCVWKNSYKSTMFYFESHKNGFIVAWFGNKSCTKSSTKDCAEIRYERFNVAVNFLHFLMFIDLVPKFQHLFSCRSLLTNTCIISFLLTNSKQYHTTNCFSCCIQVPLQLNKYK